MAWWLRTGRIVRGFDPGELPSLTASHPLVDAPPEAVDEHAALEGRDPWFHNHLVVASRVVAAALGATCRPGAKVLDFGCGEGVTALGVARRTGAEVWGVDLTRAFDALPARAEQALGPGACPPTLAFGQAVAGEPLPAADAVFDAGYAWSVFEHLDDVSGTLRELRRVLKPGAPFLLQIEPLYLSPYGSHLRRLIDEPWAHLKIGDTEYLARVQAAADHSSVVERDLLYQQNEFEEVRRYLMGEYRSLNRIRTVELVRQVLEGGWQIEDCALRQISARRLEPDLLRRHSAHDLRTREIRLLLKRPSAQP